MPYPRFDRDQMLQSVSRTLTIGTWSPSRDVAVPVRSVMLGMMLMLITPSAAMREQASGAPERLAAAPICQPTVPSSKGSPAALTS